MGRGVAGGAGIGVVAPDAADALGLLEDGEGGEARLAQPDGETDAAESASDDGDGRLSAPITDTHVG